MRRSHTVTLGLLASFALAACNREMKRCVDDKNAVVDDSYCTGSGGAPFGGYRWYYGGTGGYTRGAIVSGGSYTPHASSVSRGGFGSYFGHGSSSSGGSSGGS